MRRAGCAAAALALVLLAASLATCPASADAFPCSGAGTDAANSACGAVFSSAAGPGSYLPTILCAACPSGSGGANGGGDSNGSGGVGCGCPRSDCLSVVSACREAEPSGLLNLKIGLGGCKYAKAADSNANSTSRTSTAPGTRIEWVAFQGVDEQGQRHVNHGWLREAANRLPDTSLCANAAGGNASTCCLQANVQGNGQVNLFKLGCGTRSVIWMGDASFSSCNAAAPAEEAAAAVGAAGSGGGGVAEGGAAAAADAAALLPSYLFQGPEGGGSFCGAPASTPPGQVCGPYTLPPLNCTMLPLC